MPQAPIDVGPLRASRTAVRGLVDVRFDGDTLALIRFVTPVELLDRYRFPIVGYVAVFAFAAVRAHGILREVMLVLAGVCLAGLLLLGVVELVITLGALGSAGGPAAAYRVARSRHAGTLVVIPEPDIELMDPVYGAWRAHLVLYTTSGELRLSGWWWRRGQLNRLQKALAR